MYAEAVPQLLGNALQSGTWYFPAGNAKNNFASRTDIVEALANGINQPLSHAGEFDIRDTSLENLLGWKPADLKVYLKMLV
jgi:hypothetical protein